MVKAAGKTIARPRPVRVDGSETKHLIVEAAMRTVASRGYRGTTARGIADEGRFNSPLIFYHFGGVDPLLLEALELASGRRLNRYRSAMDSLDDPAVLFERLRALWVEERESPEIKVIQELVDAPAFAAERRDKIAGLLQPWFDYTSEVIAKVIDGTAIADFISARDAAVVLVALLLGLEKLEDVVPDGTGIDSLFDTAQAVIPLLSRFLKKPSSPRSGRRMRRVQVH